ncbi:MAG: alpha/beta hydrolase-fold protein [Oculatellaceae cyanobacterium bins.114]|nr:alpha/beta hydrolase-fold protein [Oculatellaceae cyanobacterium bins.114]
MKRLNLTSTGRLQSHSMPPSKTEGTPGLHPLNLGNQRDGWLYVPATYHPDRPAPLLLMLHGAGGDAEEGLGILQSWADLFSVLVLAVDSRQKTWDVIISRYGPDIAFIDQALAKTFTHYTINPNQVAIAGFSDGASYALSVGITNGDLFTHILAFSPGFMAPIDQVGKPQIFIAHGQRDAVLPIDQCSRRIVMLLQRKDYAVVYREFDGPHIVPEAIAREAVQWLINGS